MRIPFTGHRLVLIADDDAVWLAAHLDMEREYTRGNGEWQQSRREQCRRIADSLDCERDDE